jgi:hypothetical protein
VNAYTRILSVDPAGNGAIAAADIQHGCTRRNPGGEKIRKNANAAAEYSAAVRQFNH